VVKAVNAQVMVVAVVMVMAGASIVVMVAAVVLLVRQAGAASDAGGGGCASRGIGRGGGGVGGADLTECLHSRISTAKQRVSHRAPHALDTSVCTCEQAGPQANWLAPMKPVWHLNFIFTLEENQSVTF
jgi:hypothetical protein